MCRPVNTDDLFLQQELSKALPSKGQAVSLPWDIGSSGVWVPQDVVPEDQAG
jgi:hypothetical protein